MNGATCNDEVNGFNCTCAPGYEGDRCQTEINECELYTPCENSAVCVDLVADYRWVDFFGFLFFYYFMFFINITQQSYDYKGHC